MTKAQDRVQLASDIEIMKGFIAEDKSRITRLSETTNRTDQENRNLADAEESLSLHEEGLEKSRKEMNKL